VLGVTRARRLGVSLLGERSERREASIRTSEASIRTSEASIRTSEAPLGTSEAPTLTVVSDFDAPDGAADDGEAHAAAGVEG